MPDDQQYGAKPLIEVDGSPLPANLEPVVEQVVVDDHLHLPDMFVLRMRDEAKDLLERAGIRIGTKVRLSATALGDGTQQPLIEGEVTALEAEYDKSGSHAVVRGYDLSHRLCRGRHTEAFKDVTDSEIARRVVQAAGISIGRVDEATTRYEHVSQVNMTDWAFLKARAAETGYEVAVVHDRFEWRRPARSADAPGSGDLDSTNPLQLTLGANLEYFRPRLSSAEQPKEVVVRGWDPRRKEKVESSAASGTTSASGPVSPADMAHTFGDPVYVEVNRPLATVAEAESAARSIAEQIGSAHLEAEGMARGNPRLTAGTAVAIGLTGGYDGRYVLTSTRHVYDANGYRTYFEVSGGQERSLLGLASLGATRGSQAAGGPPVFGVVIAVVTDVNDPDGFGRVKVKFPWLSDSYETWWARLAQLGAGHQRGAVWLPEVNDEVLVAFEHGDVRRPYVIGSLYNGVDTPMLGDGLIDGSTGAVTRRGFVSKQGHKLVFFDSDSQSGVAVMNGGGDLKISLNQTDTTIRISSSGKVEISGTGEITVKSDSSVKVEASTSLELKASSGIKIDGGAQVEIKGAMVKIN